MFSGLKLVKRKKDQSESTDKFEVSSGGVKGSSVVDDDTVITNFTEPYLEAYFDGELESGEERRLEGVLGERYVQDQMLKRGELRSIISRNAKLSVPSSHDLKQEKKRVWNEIEHELRMHLNASPVVSEEKPRVPKFSFSLSRGVLAGVSFGLIVGFMLLGNFNFPPSGGNVLSHNDGQREYVLNHPREIREMLKVVKDESPGYLSRVSSRNLLMQNDIREFEAHNQLIANLNQEELNDLSKEMLIRDRFEDNSSLLTFVSNR